MLRLNDIEDKVTSGERLNREDGIRLLESPDLLSLGRMADLVRRRKAGDAAYYSTSLNINPTNICVNRCPLCAFSRDAQDKDAYRFTLEDVEKKVREFAYNGLDEVHIVGGLYPELRLSYFEEMLERIKNIRKDLHIQAFTAVEIDYLAQQEDVPAEEVLRRLKNAGLGTIPGGGAEIFSERVRREICPKKISGRRWLEVMRAAHRLGIKTNATMLYGHIETREEIIDHLLSLRSLQDETRLNNGGQAGGGFLAFVPLAFHPQNTAFPDLPGPGGYDDLKIFAVARLMLDNFDHIRGLWMYLGVKMAEVALSFGVDDLGSTSLEERIVHSAGAKAPAHSGPETLVRIIRQAGRVPMRADSSYSPCPSCAA